MTKTAPPHRPKGFTSIMIYLLIIIILIAFYWINFFTTEEVQVTKETCYLIYQNAFPLADSWTGLCALLSIIGLLRQKDWGILFGIIAGAEVLMIGFLDILYNLNTDKYILHNTDPAMWFEMFLNFLCLFIGTQLIRLLWKNRKYLSY